MTYHLMNWRLLRSVAALSLPTVVVVALGVRKKKESLYRIEVRSANCTNYKIKGGIQYGIE